MKMGNMDRNERRGDVVVKRGRLTNFQNSPFAYTVVFTAATTFYYLFWGGIFSVLSSIEKRYSFASWQSGLITAGAEYGRVVALIPMSYLGGRSHVPRITGASLLLCACVMVMIASPHFILNPSTDLDELKNTDDKGVSNGLVCLTKGVVNHSGRSNMTSERDTHQSYVSDTAFKIFLTAMILLGICASPLTNISTAYVDINATAQKLPLYMGITSSAISIGPMIGAFVGTWATSVYVDLSYPLITPDHPAWVGAWWIVLAAVIVGTVLSAPFMFCFPKRMAREVDDVVVKSDNFLQEMALVDEDVPESSATISHGIPKRMSRYAISDFLRTAWRIVCNPIFMLLTLTRLCMEMVMWGYYAFLAKYIEVEFQAPYSTATIVSGMAILSLGVGCIISGFVVTIFKFSYRRTAEFIMAANVVGIVLIVTLMFLGCADVQLPESDHIAACASGCHCDLTAVSPVCDVDAGVTYLSACLAGCLETHRNGSFAVEHFSCNCTSSGRAIPGLCSSCADMPAYIGLVLLLYLVLGFVLSPVLSLTLRSVNEGDKGLAMGIHILLIALLSWMPSTILYGLVIDASCQLWQILGTTTGYCHIYSRSGYRLNLHGFTAGVLGLELLFITVSLVFVRRRHFKWETQTIRQ